MAIPVAFPFLLRHTNGTAIGVDSQREMHVSVTDQSLLERLCCHPDAPSWQRLVALYTPLVRKWLLQQSAPGNDVEDLVQEVLAALVQHLPRFEHNGRAGAFRC